MGCGSCGTVSADGKPSGCQSNGGCSTGGCNRLNVFNWLSDIPFSDLGKPYPIVEIAFNNGSRKDFFRNQTNHIFEKGAWVAVEGASGFDVGQISLTGELVKLQLKKYNVSPDSAEMKRVLRPAAERDLEVYQNAKERERETLVRARAISKELNLEMKIAEAEYQADAKKVTFFYTADSRVDFRELIKVYASEFRAKVEMRQIGARQESGKVGGIGSCGRELCCSTWLTDFKTVNTTAARYQNLSINQTKLSGQCGRLKCCLNYELDTYMDALHSFPEGAEQLEVVSGRAYLQKKDIFRNLMWYSFGGSNKQYPLTIERVLEIKTLNADGKKPEDLEAVEIQIKQKDAEKTVDMGFVNDVGQLTLSSLSKSNKKKQQPQQQNKQQKGNAPQKGAQPQAKAPQQAGANKPQQQAAGNKQPQQAAAANGEKPKQQPQQPRPNNPNQGNNNKPKQQAGPKPQQQPNPQKQQQAKPAQQGGNQNPPKQQPNKPQQQPRPQQQAGSPEAAADKAANSLEARPNNRPQQQRKKFNRPQNTDKKDQNSPQKESE